MLYQAPATCHLLCRNTTIIHDQDALAARLLAASSHLILRLPCWLGATCANVGVGLLPTGGTAVERGLITGEPGQSERPAPGRNRRCHSRPFRTRALQQCWFASS